MKVEIRDEMKRPRIDHLFALVAEEGDLEVNEEIRGILEDVKERSDFQGRAEETITALTDSPRKVTLVGVGKANEFSIRALTKALAVVAKTAQKQRDRRIAVAVSPALRDMEIEPATRLIASLLAHADYKYDAYQTQKKEEKQFIQAVLLAPPNLNGKRLRALDAEANAIPERMRTVRRESGSSRSIARSSDMSAGSTVNRRVPPVFVALSMPSCPDRASSSR